MAGTRCGAMKAHAKKLGLTLAEYMAHLDAGERHCNRCGQWKPIDAFDRDRSRSDSVDRKCKTCRRRPRKTDNPTASDRRRMAAQGMKWCSDCREWLPADRVTKNGRCRPHAAEVYRAYYRGKGGHAIRTRAYRRKRNVEDVPDEGRTVLMMIFDGQCAYCCTREATTFDHIEPVKRGGQTRPGNIVPACLTCNSSKRDRDAAEWMRAKGYVASDEFLSIVVLSEMPIGGH